MGEPFGVEEKKDFVFLAKLKFSKSIDPKKKHIYRI